MDQTKHMILLFKFTYTFLLATAEFFLEVELLMTLVEFFLLALPLDRVDIFRCSVEALVEFFLEVIPLLLTEPAEVEFFREEDWPPLDEDEEFFRPEKLDFLDTEVEFEVASSLVEVTSLEEVLEEDSNVWEDEIEYLYPALEVEVTRLTADAVEVTSDAEKRDGRERGNN